MKNKQVIYSPQQYVIFLNDGSQMALDYFYNRFYQDLYFKAKIATGDSGASQTFIQEAFFRLWLFRSNVHSVSSVQKLLDSEVKRSIHNFYNNASEQFQRNFVPLDSFQDTSNVLRVSEDDMEQSSAGQCPEERTYIRKINALMPNLRQDQQVLIRLCLEYGFNYDRIADRLGGRSSQEVRHQVQQAIAHIRSVFENTDKLQRLEKKSRDTKATNLNLEEEKILYLRCECQFSFPEIATEMNIDLDRTHHLFVKAFRKTKMSIL